MTHKLEKIDDFRWRLPKTGKMNTEGLIFATEKMLSAITNDPCVEQVANVACLPGIVGKSMAMPDIHWGYGFPIGGVAAFDAEKGVISPGGVGYDINCGVRLLRTDLTSEEVRPRIEELLNVLFRNIPSGVGSEGIVKLNARELQDVLIRGAEWAVQKGYGASDDLQFIEEGGRMHDANPEYASARAKERGKTQVGSLGSGNHFLEIDIVDEVYDAEKAAVMGLRKNQIVAFIHTGSRGLGHQICEDYIDVMNNAARKYGIELPDRQLCCAPVRSEEGQKYLFAMQCAVNFAFANRQMITHWVRESFEKIFKKSASALNMRVIYDIAHNIAKIEDHEVDGKMTKLCVHRKGATRAFPPEHPQIPKLYKNIGQPVLIPGDMGRYSYVLVGTGKSYKETFGSTCHGAGRLMSRNQAIKIARGRQLFKEMRDKGILVKAEGQRTIAEEISEAYKDVADVVEAVVGAGISEKVAKLRPIGVIKG